MHTEFVANQVWYMNPELQIDLELRVSVLMLYFLPLEARQIFIRLHFN